MPSWPRPLLLILVLSLCPVLAVAQEPPQVAPDCRAQLLASGVRFAEWPVRPALLAGRPICLVPTGIRLLRTPSKIRYSKPPRINCAFAARLLRLEEVVHEEAKRHFGRPVARIEHLGTYSCRKMAAYPDLVSEHAYGNAIDLKALILKGGRRIDVGRHFVTGGKPTTDPAALFLRGLARRLYDEKIFTVVLTPNYDRHHRNHFHLDGAPYTVDGT